MDIDQRHANIRVLINMSRDGAAYYRTAARLTRRAAVQEPCRRMAEAKESLAVTLSRQMPETKDFTQQEVSVDVPRDLSRLERAETQLLSTFERALQGSDTPELRRALKRYLPQATSCLNALRRAV